MEGENAQAKERAIAEAAGLTLERVSSGCWSPQTAGTDRAVVVGEEVLLCVLGRRGGGTLSSRTGVDSWRSGPSFLRTEAGSGANGTPACRAAPHFLASQPRHLQHNLHRPPSDGQGPEPSPQIAPALRPLGAPNREIFMAFNNHASRTSQISLQDHDTLPVVPAAQGAGLEKNCLSTAETAMRRAAKTKRTFKLISSRRLIPITPVSPGKLWFLYPSASPHSPLYY